MAQTDARSEATNANPIAPEFVEMLRCPTTGSKLTLAVEGDQAWLIAAEGGAKYPIINGIPNLLPNDAAKPDADAGH